MTVSADRTELPQSGRTWITLIASTIALFMLFAWALRNPTKLLRHNAFSTQVAITEQSEPESKLAGNVVAQNDDDADTSTKAIVADPGTTTDTTQVVTAQVDAEVNQVEVNKKGDPAAAALEGKGAGTIAVAPDQQEAGGKPATINAESRNAEKLAAAQVADKEDTKKTEASKVVDDRAAVDDPASKPAAKQKLASRTPETVEKGARQLAAERLAAVQADRLATENSFAEKLAKEKEAVDTALADKLAAENAAKDDVAKQAAEKKAAAVKAAADKAAVEKAAAEKAAAEKAAAEKAAAEKAAAEKVAAEKAAAEKAAAEKAAAEKAAAEKALAEKAAAEKAAEEKAAAEKAVADNNARAQNLETENQAVEQLAALPSTGINDAVKAVVPENETAFEKSRREDLAKLPELAARIRFANNDTETTGDSKLLMDRIFELLFLYSETNVTVQVASNEYQLDDTNQLISRLRSLVIINYLIKRGLDEGRFKVRALGKQGLSFNSHQVSVAATVIDNGE